MSELDGFTRKVRWPSSFTACWLWAAQVDRYGYGRASRGGRAIGAHRVAYELSRGPIPTGLHIDHLCRVRRCVNPLHLDAVEKRVNDARGFSPQAINARKTHCKRGHEFTEANTYVRIGKRCCRTCNRLAVRALYARRKDARTRDVAS